MMLEIRPLGPRYLARVFAPCSASCLLVAGLLAACDSGSEDVSPGIDEDVEADAARDADVDDAPDNHEDEDVDVDPGPPETTPPPRDTEHEVQDPPPPPPPPPLWYLQEWETTVFTPESDLFDTADGPHPAMPDIFCDDVDAVVAQCEDDVGLPGVASCRLRMKSPEDYGGSLFMTCPDPGANWCRVSEREYTPEQRRYQACRDILVHRQCGLAAHFHRAWEEGSLEADLTSTRSGGYYLLESAAWSDERRAAWVDFFRGEFPTLGGARCVPVRHDEDGNDGWRACRCELP